MPAQNLTPFRLVFVLLTLAIISLHTAQFSGRYYRQDEAWPVEIGLLKTVPEVVVWSSNTIHPAGWRVAIDIWIDFFGQTEPVTRFMSSLYMALALAFTYRLGADTFDRRIGLLGVFIVGTLPFIQFYGHEVRPYPSLLMGTVGTIFAFERWLRRPNFRRALFFVVFGIGLLYTHFYALFVIAALAIYFLFLVRWDRALLIRAAGLFAAVLLSFLGWLLPFLHAVIIGDPGGINYGLSSNPELIGSTLQAIYENMQIYPAGFGLLLLILGIITPYRRPPAPSDQARFRWSASWGKIYILTLPLLILLMVFISNNLVTNLTPRNLVVVVPMLALLAGLAIASFASRTQFVMLGLIAIASVTSFRPLSTNGPFPGFIELVQREYRPDHGILLDMASLPAQIPILYYLTERSPMIDPTDIYSLGLGAASTLTNMPRRPDNLAINAQPETLEHFNAYLSQSATLWYLTNDRPANFNEPFVQMIADQYLPMRQVAWGRDQAEPRPHYFYLTEYRRIPELREMFRFGDHITLQAWMLRESVEAQACQSLTLESWWQSDDSLPDNYSLTLVLANSDGVGVANTDSEPAGVLTQLWQADQIYLDERTVTIPCAAAPGDYPLLIGLYDPDTLTPLTSSAGDLVYLTTINVR